MTVEDITGLRELRAGKEAELAAAWNAFRRGESVIVTSLRVRELNFALSAIDFRMADALAAQPLRIKWKTEDASLLGHR